MNEITEKEDSLTSQSVWILFAKTVGFGLNILLPLLIVRYLTQDKVGVYRQVFLVVTNAVTILPLGFSMSAYYFLNREPEKHSSVIFNIVMFNFVMGGLAFLTLFFFPQLLGNLFHNPEITRLSPLIGLVIWLWIFSSFLEIVALANREARLATFFIILAQFTKLLLMAGAVIVFATIEAFIYAAMVQAVLQTIILLAYLQRRFSLFWKSFNWKFFREQITYALPFGLAALLYTSQTDIHNYFVSYRFSPAEFAIYSQGCFEIPLIAILYESISAVVIPRMSQLQAQGKKREMLLMTVNAMQKLALAYFPLFFFLMIVAGEFITTLFTRDYLASVPIFRINLLLLPFFCLMVDPIGRAFPEVGRFLLKMRIVLFAVLILALWIGIYHLDLRGMIAIVIVAIVIEKIASVWKALRMLEVKREDVYLLKNVGKTALAAAAAAVFLLAFYLPARNFLMELCLDISRRALVLIHFEKAMYFFGGILFLGICFIIYAPVYLFLANRFGAIPSEDRESIVNAFNNLLRKRGLQLKKQKLKVGNPSQVMLKGIKQNLLKSVKALGLFQLSSKSRWRQSKLLILAYHGISLEDEHVWNSSLFVPPDFLRQRFEIIKQQGCTVLPLDEAIERLYNETLPEKAVAITFDDGNYDFYQQALPIIKEFNFPVTLYLTSFYSQYNKPVFAVAVDYLLWKAKSKILDCNLLLGVNKQIDLAKDVNRRQAHALVLAFALKNKFSAEQKNHLLEQLCDELEINYTEFCGKRILQLMNKEEVAGITSAGVDVQLHTHRHRVPLEEKLFKREIEDNRQVIAAATAKEATHFCYPSGEYNSQLFTWMEAVNVVSATTCEPALSTSKTHPFKLPRLVDGCLLSEIEFEGWLTGISHFLPQR